MYYILLYLTRLVGVDLHYREVNGKMEECISIPMRLNGIEKKYENNKVFWGIYMYPDKPNSQNKSHYLAIELKNPEAKKDMMKISGDTWLRYVGSVFPTRKKMTKEMKELTDGNE